MSTRVHVRKRLLCSTLTFNNLLKKENTDEANRSYIR